MTTKKLLSLAMASTLAVSMTAPAFALGESTGADASADGTSNNNQVSFNYNGEIVPYKAPVIDITVPTTESSIVLNPYHMDYAAAGAISKKSVITDGYKYIANNSAFDIKVAWEVLGTASEGVTFATTGPSSWDATSAKKKQVYLPVMLSATANNTSANPTALQKAGAPVVVKATAQKNDKDAEIVVNKKGGASAFLGFGIDTATAEACGGYYGADTTGGTPSGGDGIPDEHVDMTTNWTKDDAVSVSFVFTFAKK